MKRHKKLIRALLEYAEENATGEGAPAPEIEGYSIVEVHYHIGLCAEEGWLKTKDATISTDVGQRFKIINLTARGHDKLDQSRKKLEWGVAK